ncbi:MAG: hypothetical protein AAF514_12690 [Verrucomicrobiota bacterium]
MKRHCLSSLSAIVVQLALHPLHLHAQIDDFNEGNPILPGPTEPAFSSMT